MGAAFFSLGVLDHGTLAKVNLGLLAGGAFQTVDTLGLSLANLCGKALYGLVGASEAKAVTQFTVDALGSQPRLKAACDEGFVIAAEAFSRRDREGFWQDFHGFRSGPFGRGTSRHFGGEV